MSWLLVVSLLLAGCQEGARLPAWLEDTQPPGESAPAESVAPPPESAVADAREAPLPPGLPLEPPLESLLESGLVTGDLAAPERESAALEAAPRIEVAPLEVFVPQPIKIGLLVPLTGRGKAEGRALLDAAQLALFEVGADRLVILPRDTASTGEGAARAAQEVIAEGAELILGPHFSESVRAVAPLAAAAGIHVVAFSTDPRAAVGGVFLIGFASGQQVERIVNYSREQGLTRFAVLAPDNAYGRSVVEQFRRAVEGSGARLIRLAFYAADASETTEIVRYLADYDRRHGALEAQRAQLVEQDDEISRQALKRLEGLDTIGNPPFEALLLADGGQALRAVTPLLSYFDIDPGKVQLLGTGLWDDPESLADPALVGGWFVSSGPGAREGFERRFEAVYGRAPLRLATLAYDATALAAALARFTGGPDFSASRLSSPDGFMGVDGIFRFASDGIAERGLAVLEVLPGGDVGVLSAPLERFRLASP